MKRVIAVAVVLALALGAWLLFRPSAEEGIPAGSQPPPARPAAAPPAPAPAPAPPPPAPAPATPPAPPSPAPPARGSARITVLGPDGRPLQGALVVLWEGVPDPGSPLALERKTGSDGAAVFGDLPGQNYTVRAGAPGFVNRDWWIRIEKGVEATREFHLERDQALRGRVTAAKGGAPLPEARVEVHRADDAPFFRDDPLASSLSDSDGRFRMEGVPSDEKVVVLVTRRGFVEAQRSVLLAADGSGDRDLQVALDPAGAVEGVLRDGAGSPVSGALVLVAAQDDEDERLLESPGRSSNGRSALSARTAADGAFEVDGLPLGIVFAAAAMTRDGRRSPVEKDLAPTEAAPRVHRDLRLASGALLRVRILGPDGRPARGARPDFPDEDLDEKRWKAPATGVFEALVALPGPKKVEATAEGLVFEVRSVEVPPAGTLEVEFRLQEGAAIEGTVVDENGSPLAAVELEPQPADPEHHRGGERDFPRRNRPGTISDREGRFRIAGLRPGAYTVYALIGDEFRADEDHRFTAPSEGVRIVVPGAASAVVRLRVPEGCVAPDRVQFGRWEVEENRRSGSTDMVPWNGGSIRWPNLAPGKKVLTVRAKGFLALSFDVEVAPGRELDLGEREFLPGFSLEVRVTDAAGGPVPGARVVGGADREDLALPGGLPEELLSRLLAEKGLLLATTGEGGGCTLGSVESPEVVLRVTKEGFLPFQATVRLPGGSPLAVVLSRGGLLRLSVLLPDGGRPESVEVSFEGPAGEAPPGSGGTWLLRPPGSLESRLSAGSWRVTVSADTAEGAVKGTVVVVLKEGEPTAAEVRLAR